LKVLAGVAVVLFTALLVVATPYFSDAGFEVVNDSSDAVTVVAAWRNRERDLGTTQPGGSFRFGLDDEGAMTFRVRYADGREAENEPIYFTSGTKVIAMISDSGVDVRYDFDS
jgi:hypothetical protein